MLCCGGFARHGRGHYSGLGSTMPCRMRRSPVRKWMLLELSIKQSGRSQRWHSFGQNRWIEGFWWDYFTAFLDPRTSCPLQLHPVSPPFGRISSVALCNVSVLVSLGSNCCLVLFVSSLSVVCLDLPLPWALVLDSRRRTLLIDWFAC